MQTACKHQDYPRVNWDALVHQHGNEQLSLEFTVISAGVFVLSDLLEMSSVTLRLNNPL